MSKNGNIIVDLEDNNIPPGSDRKGSKGQYVFQKRYVHTFGFKSQTNAGAVSKANKENNTK